MTNKEIAAALNKLTFIVEKMTPPIPAIPAIPAIPVTNSTDHDTLNTLVVSVSNLDTKLTEKFGDLKNDIKSLGDGQAMQLNDHENRLRDNSSDILVLKTKINVGGSIATAILAALEIVLHYWK